MTRFFTARCGAAKLALAISGKRFLGVALAFGLSLLSSPAFASASCDEIDADWGGGRTVGTAGVNANLDDHYAGPFAAGEVLTYSASTTGTKSTTNYNAVTIWDAGLTSGYEGNDQFAPISVSNQRYALESNSDIYISIGAYNQPDGDAEVFLQVHCAAPSPPTAQVVVADNSLLAGETSVVTITFSEPVAGFGNAALTVSNGTLSPVGTSDGGTTWTTTLTPVSGLSDSTNVITVDMTGVQGASGIAGTGTTDSNNYGINTVRPAVTGFAVTNASLTGSSSTSLVTITFSEAVTGFNNLDLTIPNGTLSAVATVDGGITWGATFTAAPGVNDSSNEIVLNLAGVTNAAGNAGSGAASSNNFTITQPTIAAVSPTIGGVSGGTSVALGGTNLRGATSVTFDGVAGTNLTVFNDDIVTVTTPAHAAGIVDIAITTPDGTATAEAAFTYTTAIPTVTSFTPTSGPSAGGTLVTLTGTHLSGATSVTFGGSGSTSLTVVNDTTITATTPSHGGAGAAAIVVTTPNGSATAPTSFNYLPLAPTLTGFTPTSGPTAGGTTVTLSGNRLATTTSVTFGGVAGTIVTAAVSSLTVTTPAHAMGTVPVILTAAGGSVTAPAPFTYVPPAPTLTSLTPINGSTAGGTAVTLTGTDLTGATGVTFDGVAGTGLTVVDAATVTVTTPAHAVGPVDVAITTPGGTATAATSFTYVPPAAVPVTLSPVSGTALPSGTVGLAYSATISASGGSGSYVYDATNLPPGLSIDAATGEISGSPTLAGTARTASVTVSDAADLANSASGSYSIAVGSDTVMNDATVGIPYPDVRLASNGSTTPGSGSIPPGMTITAVGARVIFNGTPVTTGPYVFTFANGSRYSITVQPAAPSLTFSPASGPLAAGTTGVVYAGAAIAASGGTAPYSYVATGALPAGLTLAADGSWSGTPIQAGNFSFAVTATDAATLTGTANYTLAIDPPPVAAFTPPSGAVLANAMAEEHYSQKFSVPAATAYTLSGDVPPNLHIDANGTLDGTLAVNSQRAYHFTITAATSGGPVSASYDLVVLPRAVTAVDKTVPISPGSTPLPVDLTAGATGGPFTGAILGAVSPPHAGTAEITMGDVASIDTVWSHKFYLKFHPNPAYSGPVLVGYTLIGATGSSSATVTFIASLDPNGVANNFDHLLKDFVGARASLLANGVDTPGLRQRRGMGSGTSPGTINISPSDSSVSMNFASSLLELQSWGEAGDAANALAQGGRAEAQPFNFWIDGSATLHLRSDDGDEHWGRFALVSVGGDYLVNDKLLVGLALHADFMDDIATDTTIEGTGMLIGPYVSAEIVDGVFLDASLYYGHSWNEVTTSIFDGSFETDRWLAKASLEGQWALSEALTLRPKANVFYLHETTGQYTVTDGLGSAITIAGFDTDQLRLSAGGTLEYQMDLGEGLGITPYFGAQLGLSLTQHDEAVVFTTLTTGFDLTGLGGWTLGGAIEADLESDSLKAISAKTNLSARF